MGVLDVDSKNGKVRVSSALQMMTMFLSELTDESQLLQQMLEDDPSEFENVENRVHDIFNRGAGLFVAGILAKVMQSEKHKLRGDTVRDRYATPLRSGQDRKIQIDGGRTRMRSDMIPIDPIKNFAKTQSEATGRESQGRSKEKKRTATFQAEWKEPKLFKIYVHDDNGRVDHAFSERIDGSFGTADDIERLLAMRMYQLGVHMAKTITFNSDGAQWIWDRIDAILARAKVTSSVLIYKILDIYHASENLNKGIRGLGHLAPDSPDTLAAPKPEPSLVQESFSFEQLRSALRDGNWKAVVEKLEKASESSLKNDGYDKQEVTRVIEYLRKHGEAGHMDYPLYSVSGLPLGSGSIESAIRRVVNQRLKGNGIFWRPDNAECMLAIRSSILSHRWDEDHIAAKQAMLKNRQLAFPKPKKKRKVISEAPETASQKQ
jgi:hypothetical protein